MHCRCKLVLLFSCITSSLAAANTISFDHAPQAVSHYPQEIPGLEFESPLSTQTVFFQDKLLSLASNYAKRSYVPYIWGGSRVGARKHCLACRKCSISNGVPLKSRLKKCKACRLCGLDCSHFMYRLFREAGLSYNYASTWELSRQTKKGLLKHYSMVDIGRDLTKAQVGDLLIYKRHMTMLVKIRDRQRGDFVHVTRFRWGDKHKLGGFRWDRNKNIMRFRGKLVRILRHQKFFTGDINFRVTDSFRTFYEKYVPSI